MEKNGIFRKITLLGSACLLAFTFMIHVPVNAQARKTNMAYVYFGSPSTYKAQIERTKGAVQVISPDYFNINENGTLKLTSKLDRSFISEMRKKGMKIVPFLSNHWNLELGRAALKNTDTLSDEIVAAIKEYNLDGINVDLENLKETDRDAYTNLVKVLRRKLPKGKELSVAVAANPKRLTRGWHGSYDYGALAQFSDEIILMAYDESYKGSRPGPVASGVFVENSIKVALEKVPKDKLVLAIPFYGRYWKDGEELGGDGIGLNVVEELAKKYNGRSVYDKERQSVKTIITIKSGDKDVRVGSKTLTPGTYTIWHENEESIKYKLRLVQKYGLKGTASWSLGQETKDTWNYYSLWLNGQYFKDAEGHWAQEGILAVADRGWMKGTSSTQFSPNQSLSRAQAAVTLVRALGLEGQDGKSSFKDVPEKHWAKNEINIAKEKGIIQGVGGDRFGPEELITREQMAAMLDRILVQLELDSSRENPYLDLSEEGWSYPSIMKMTQYELFRGYEDRTFRGQEKITRAQMATLMDRVANIIIQ